MKRFAFLAAVLLLIGGAFSALIAVADEADAQAVRPASVEPSFDFEGKTAVFQLNYSTNIESIMRTAVIREPRLVLLGDRWFVVGTFEQHPAQANRSAAGEIAIAWSAISEFATYTPEEYSKFATQASRKQADE